MYLIKEEKNYCEKCGKKIQNNLNSAFKFSIGTIEEGVYNWDDEIFYHKECLNV